MIIAIDGLSGVGKTSVSQMAAKKLGFKCLDTGAMFRSIGWKVIEAGGDIHDESFASETADKVEVSYEWPDGEPNADKVFANGDDVTAIIRTPQIDEASSVVSVFPAVRSRVLEMERSVASSGDYIVEGRDIGTVVFPEAEFKFYLTASPLEKARRRAAQNKEKGWTSDVAELEEQMKTRDQRDSTRQEAPCVPAPDAMAIDTDGLTLEQVCSIICSTILGENTLD